MYYKRPFKQVGAVSGREEETRAAVAAVDSWATRTERVAEYIRSQLPASEGHCGPRRHRATVQAPRGHARLAMLRPVGAREDVSRDCLGIVSSSCQELPTRLGHAVQNRASCVAALMEALGSGLDPFAAVPSIASPASIRDIGTPTVTEQAQTELDCRNHDQDRDHRSVGIPAIELAPVPVPADVDRKWSISDCDRDPLQTGGHEAIFSLPVSPMRVDISYNSPSQLSYSSSR